MAAEEVHLCLHGKDEDPQPAVLNKTMAELCLASACLTAGHVQSGNF